MFDSETGILLVGHGSRAAEGNEPVHEFCRDLERQLEITPVQPCFLEFANPTICEGLGALYRRGVVRTIIVPMQLSAGRHVRYDIPCEVGRCLRRLPEMMVCFTEHLGGHHGILELARCRLDETLAASGAADPAIVVLVARGSRDPLVRGEILRLAEVRQEMEDRTFAPCFLAMSSPTFEETLEQVAARELASVVIQPHLLLPGRLMERIRRSVDEMGQRYPATKWFTVETLGPDPRIAECALDLAQGAADQDRRFRRELV